MCLNWQGRMGVMQRSVDYLIDKHRSSRREKVPATWRGIKVSDQALGDDDAPIPYRGGHGHPRRHHDNEGGSQDGQLHHQHGAADRGLPLLQCEWYDAIAGPAVLCNQLLYQHFRKLMANPLLITRGLTIKSFRIHLSNLNSLCVTQTKRI